MIEVTTFRRDAEYSDGRHPDTVIFSTPEEDAQRRDFTINGLFYDPLEQRVIDYVDGLADLERHVVRAIGDPAHAFAEDKLRMVRAVRFAAGFDFTVDEPTLAAIDEMADTISVVSPERIAQEMRKMLVDPSRRRGRRAIAPHATAGSVVAGTDQIGRCERGPVWRLGTYKAGHVAAARAELRGGLGGAFTRARRGRHRAGRLAGSASGIPGRTNSSDGRRALATVEQRARPGSVVAR